MFWLMRLFRRMSLVNKGDQWLERNYIMILNSSGSFVMFKVETSATIRLIMEIISAP